METLQEIWKQNLPSPNYVTRSPGATCVNILRVLVHYVPIYRYKCILIKVSNYSQQVFVWFPSAVCWFRLVLFQALLAVQLDSAPASRGKSFSAALNFSL